jgi:hypothetical protein
MCVKSLQAICPEGILTSRNRTIYYTARRPATHPQLRPRHGRKQIMTTFSIVYTIGTCRTEVHLGSCGRIRSGRGLLRYDVPATSPHGAIARYVVDQHLIVDGMPEPVMCACTRDASAPVSVASPRELEVEVYPTFGADLGV